MFDRSPKPKVPVAAAARAPDRGAASPRTAEPVHYLGFVPFDLDKVSFGQPGPDSKPRSRDAGADGRPTVPPGLRLDGPPLDRSTQRIVRPAAIKPLSFTPEAIAARRAERAEHAAAPARAPRPNHVGLPPKLKAGVEALSGVAMDEVRVRYRSPEPARLGALAFARGRDIHLGPGQEQHLPHEAWHVVQQAEGRVIRPTVRKAGLPFNDDRGLEREADEMGVTALRQHPDAAGAADLSVARYDSHVSTLSKGASGLDAPIQPRWVHHEDSNDSHWEGRHEPNEDDLNQLTRLGRNRVDNAQTSLPNAPRQTGRPGVFLAARDAPEGSHGAPFPLPPVPLAQQISRPRDESIAWFYSGRNPEPHDRRSEGTIMGESAREQLDAYGMQSHPRDAHAHIKPHHAMSEDEDPERRANRHPSTQEANMQHSVHEFAQSSVAERMGGMIAGRTLSDPVPDRPGLYATLNFHSTFPTGTETRTDSQSVPYNTHRPGRHGDETKRRDELMNFHARALSSGLRDDGFLTSEDIGDQHYIPPDDQHHGYVDSDHSISDESSSEEKNDDESDEEEKLKNKKQKL